MKDELPAMISNVVATQLALESLRAKETDRALELLELNLDASVVSLGILAKEAAPNERERVTTTLRQIRDYRRAHPRRIEADLGSLANGLLVRAAHEGGERARQILAEID